MILKLLLNNPSSSSEHLEGTKEMSAGDTVLGVLTPEQRALWQLFMRQHALCLAKMDEYKNWVKYVSESYRHPRFAPQELLAQGGIITEQARCLFGRVHVLTTLFWADLYEEHKPSDSDLKLFIRQGGHVVTNPLEEVREFKDLMRDLTGEDTEDPQYLLHNQPLATSRVC